MPSSKQSGSESQETIALRSKSLPTHTRSESHLPTMMAAMKIAFLLAVAVLAFLMVADARRLLDYDDCNRGEQLHLGKTSASLCSIFAWSLGSLCCAILGHKRLFMQTCLRLIPAHSKSISDLKFHSGMQRSAVATTEG